jgi:hypothetical protein
LSKNCTAPAAAGLSVAVRVTAVPDGCGLAGEAASVVVVGVTNGNSWAHPLAGTVVPSRVTGDDVVLYPMSVSQ